MRASVWVCEHQCTWVTARSCACVCNLCQNDLHEIPSAFMIHKGAVAIPQAVHTWRFKEYPQGRRDRRVERHRQNRFHARIGKCAVARENGEHLLLGRHAYARPRCLVARKLLDRTQAHGAVACRICHATRHCVLHIRARCNTGLQGLRRCHRTKSKRDQYTHMGVQPRTAHAVCSRGWTPPTEMVR